VFGTLAFDFPGATAQWYFEETDFNTSDHPLGYGSGPMYFDLSSQTWIVVLERGTDSGKFLAGDLSFSNGASSCAYAYEGAAYRVTIVGSDIMGYFAASEQ